MVSFRRRLFPLLLLALVLFILGTVGYMQIEGWSLVEAFYMTVIALTTVGFGEVRPLSDAGRIFTAVLILFGVSSVAYGFSSVAELLFTASIGGELRRRRMTREIRRMRDHVIVCGYGRVGQSAVESLRESRRDVVLIENDPERVQAAQQAGLTVVAGDATRDDVLQQAGITHAWGLIVSTGDDSHNLFIVLSARALNADLFIVTRSVEAESEAKMRLAGANRVVSPYRIGGRHMANVIVRPHVTDFFDVVTLDGGVELWVEELFVAAGSPLVGQTVGMADIRRRTGVVIVALVHAGENKTITPHADTVLQAGDELIVLGTREQLAQLEILTASRGVS
ncbi:MAG: potassium channel protein [Anaerolineales bacterium]|nr:potassium channel protein [Anaerolineales bacterium]